MIKLLDRNFPINKEVNIYSLCCVFEEMHEDAYTFQGEMHPFWEFLFVVDGTVFVSGDNRTYKLEKNAIVFHKPMEFHTVSTVDSTPCRFFVASFYANGKMLSKLENTVMYLDEKSLEFMNAIITEYRTVTNNSLGYRDFYQYTDNVSYTHTIANYLELMFINLQNRPSTIEVYSYDNKDYENYKKIIAYLIKNITQNITVEDIAKEFCMSTSTLKRKFSEFSTIGIHKYFLKLKVTEASYLLRESSIADVCEKLGFRDPNYFSFVFKREYGIPPSEYIKKFKTIQ